MDTDDQEDRQLVARICEGNEPALQNLLRKYSPHLCQFAFSILRRHDLAQEAVANVFITVWRRRHALLITTNVRGYLFSAASNHALKLLRSQVHPDEIPIDHVPSGQLREGTGADSALLYREFMAEIDALLETMPPERRQVFRMNRLENLRYKEIAAALGISVNRVQKHMLKASRQISAALPGLDRRLRHDTDQE
ncbi:RNA polymerase sigma factor, sigma-70 family [Opitutaceae bacterium TAV1]|nr:RNA polymerase sigma factor, sigma-70 family [Opitutaceae bacterium TAV1]